MASVRRIESFLNAEVGKFTSENKDLDTDGRIFTTLDPSSILIAIPITGEIIRNQKGEIDVDVFALSLVASSLVPLLPAGNGRNAPIYRLALCCNVTLLLKTTLGSNPKEFEDTIRNKMKDVDFAASFRSFQRLEL